MAPPAKVDSTVVTKTLSAEIVKICDEVVVISGFLRKQIEYQALVEGEIIPNHVIIDNIPFTCLIDREDIKASDRFIISSLDIICEVSGTEGSFSSDKNTEDKVALQHVEKVVIKVCIDKDED
ncbi:hypothetical protein LG329_03370 [Virgibacillus necropolis]|uniref:hypothetical protein n=1 Tax=Virgibacillus necropolis TaxID=163877 RepID=UPI0038503BFC